MLAMHYRYVLPADYDMGIIRRRIQERGAQLDDHPGLAFKAWLSADRGAGRLPTPCNAYAPFYVWQEADAMSRFLTSPAIDGLARSFGWPAVMWWQVWSSMSGALAESVCASVEHVPVAPWTDLGGLREQEIATAGRMAAQGALASIVALDASRWSLVRMQLWPELRPDLASQQRQLYDVGHVSIGRPIPSH